MGRILPMIRHQSVVHTFYKLAKTHDPISMRLHVRCRVGGISQDQTRPFAYNKRSAQKPYGFLSSYLEDSGTQPGLDDADHIQGLSASQPLFDDCPGCTTGGKAL